MEIIGCYNIEVSGLTYDENSNCYAMVEFVKFSNEDVQINRKILYFYVPKRTLIQNCIPKFETEKQVENFLRDKRNFQKFFLKHIDKITEM